VNSTASEPLKGFEPKLSLHYSRAKKWLDFQGHGHGFEGQSGHSQGHSRFLVEAYQSTVRLDLCIVKFITFSLHTRLAKYLLNRVTHIHETIRSTNN